MTTSNLLSTFDRARAKARAWAGRYWDEVGRFQPKGKPKEFSSTWTSGSRVLIDRHHILMEPELFTTFFAEVRESDEFTPANAVVVALAVLSMLKEEGTRDPEPIDVERRIIDQLVADLRQHYEDTKPEIQIRHAADIVIFHLACSKVSSQLSEQAKLCVQLHIRDVVNPALITLNREVYGLTERLERHQEQLQCDLHLPEFLSRRLAAMFLGGKCRCPEAIFPCTNRANHARKVNTCSHYHQLKAYEPRGAKDKAIRPRNEWCLAAFVEKAVLGNQGTPVGDANRGRYQVRGSAFVAGLLYVQLWDVGVKDLTDVDVMARRCTAKNCGGHVNLFEGKIYCEDEEDGRPEWRPALRGGHLILTDPDGCYAERKYRKCKARRALSSTDLAPKQWHKFFANLSNMGDYDPEQTSLAGHIWACLSEENREAIRGFIENTLAEVPDQLVTALNQVLDNREFAVTHALSRLWPMGWGLSKESQENGLKPLCAPKRSTELCERLNKLKERKQSPVDQAWLDYSRDLFRSFWTDLKLNCSTPILTEAVNEVVPCTTCGAIAGPTEDLSTYYEYVGQDRARQAAHTRPWWRQFDHRTHYSPLGIVRRTGSHRWEAVALYHLGGEEKEQIGPGDFATPREAKTCVESMARKLQQHGESVVFGDPQDKYVDGLPALLAEIVPATSDVRPWKDEARAQYPTGWEATVVNLVTTDLANWSWLPQLDDAGTTKQWTDLWEALSVETRPKSWRELRAIAGKMRKTLAQIISKYLDDEYGSSS